ncbi:hypothetical protein [Parasitella parasitica]|uniref:F-box domain-containing protein n=1 Tax=Parasitella parasitica TaxID=35722 RepID=A0A0B7N3C5_9FUNG|nr:hypothetical protein [Parasitella parasitica]
MNTLDVEQEQALEEFRNNWRQEVREKHSRNKQPEVPSSEKQDCLTHNTSEEESIADIIDHTKSLATTEEEKEPVTAMDHYVIAVDNERQGKLGKALDSYRRAFRLDPNIDYAYEQHYQKEILPKIQESNVRPKMHSEDFKHFIPLGREYTAPSAMRTDPLADLITQFSNEEGLSYIPRLDYKSVAISKLPSEIMVDILRFLVLHSLSTMPFFALTCKKFFLLSRNPSIWQYACIRVFKDPSMTLEQSKRRQLDYVRKYNGHWMRMFIDRPRIRYDGIYISTCNYIRPGTSDIGWNQPIHVITYYRYLRFFPNGTILKHVTTEEPQNIVKLLQPGFDKKQCFHGRFTLDGEDHINIVMKDKTMPKLMFNMKLIIKTTHRGRHNKLVWDEYSSFSDIPNRGSDLFDLKSLKAFFFSPVRSYTTCYPSELNDMDESLMIM